jgi:adenylosuccinate synthase
MAGKIQVVVGGQFGSEGKGHAAAELAKREGQMLAIRTGGPNAGHTVWGLPTSPGALNQDPTAKVEYKLRQLPVAPVVNPLAKPAIAAGGLVDLEVLERELKETGQVVVIDPQATILEPKHRLAEETDSDLAWGSTRKGIGSARADRLHRTARIWGDEVTWAHGASSGNVAELARSYLAEGHTVQIEAAQGYGLGLHTQYYPKTTSADCRAIDALADVGISPWEFPDSALEVWVVIRPHPIRVAGDSGPLHEETSWGALGLPEERTTVTNKVRRVGGWDAALVRDAVVANGGGQNVKLWLNMADHIFPHLAGTTGFDFNNDLEHRVENMNVARWLAELSNDVSAPIHALGTGPDTAIFLGGY